jgi:hypothetical protein
MAYRNLDSLSRKIDRKITKKQIKISRCDLCKKFEQLHSSIPILVETEVGKELYRKKMLKKKNKSSKKSELVLIN